jgi:thioredoxin-disulfide reductase
MKEQYELIIIGGGPAGITAGIYAGRKKLDTLFLAKEFGGMMAGKSVTIENYPGFEEISGSDLIRKFENQLKKQHLDVLREDAAKLERKGNSFSISTETGKQFLSKAVIISSGSEHRTLDVEGEKEFLGKGVAYCSTCDGPMFSRKTVAVVGGGNAGFESALFLTSYASKVYVLEAGEKALADEVLQEKALKTGKIEVIANVLVQRIKGEKFVKSLEYQDKKTKENKVLELSGIFLEIGWRPASSLIKGLADLNEKGEIVIDSKNRTSLPGLFAAGDVSSVPYKQIVVAAGEGAKAALSAYEYLQQN